MHAKRSIDKTARWLGPFLEKHGRALRSRVGADPRRVLGCGSWGCVLPMQPDRNGAGWVLKVTVDPTEAPLVQSIIHLREHGKSLLEGIVFYRQSPCLGPYLRVKGKTRPSYLIVREAVEPFSREDLKRYPRAADLIEDIRVSAEAFYRAKSAGSRQEAEHRYARKIQALLDEPKMEALAQSLYDLYKQEIVLADAHFGNLGRTVKSWGGGHRPKGTIVLFDVGNTPLSSGEEHLEFYSCEW